MAAQFYKINYKSDFVLTINSDAGWAVPFCIKFWTGMPSHGYFAGFDGENYVNCRVGETPTQLLVMFDDHHMPIGPLRMQIAYHTTIEEFPDRKFDEVTNPTNVTVDIDGTEYQVMLDFTGETGAEIDFSMPSSGVMSVNGKIGYVTLNAEDVGAQPTIEDLATIRSGAAEGATAVQPDEMTAALATKQNVIEDLATIRSGAAAGATAYQKPGTGIPESDLASGVQLSLHKANAAAPQSNTYTKGEVDTLIAGAISDIDVDDALSTTSENPVQNKVVTTALNGKQATISDLATIRSGAAAGATAVQPAALTPIENDIDAIEGKIPSAASTSNQLADKAFVNSALADKADTSDIPTALSQLSQDSTHRVVTDAEKATWNGKQNAIDDLSTIRSGAAAGATAVQPAAMNTALAAKQDTLTFDNTPTANSNNPVKSSGIKTALDAKQSTISTVNVTVDNNTGTPSGSASVSGSTLSLSFQNLKGATGATGATGPQGPQGERGLPGESGVTGDVSGFTVIQTIDPSATYGATDIAGAATVQAINEELAELEGKLGFAAEVRFVEGTAYINTSGAVASSTTSHYSYPFLLQKGQTITVITGGSSVAHISSTTDPTGNTKPYTPLVTSNSSGAYSYTATEDIYIVICLRVSGGTYSITPDGLLIEQVAKNTSDIGELIQGTENKDVEEGVYYLVKNSTLTRFTDEQYSLSPLIPITNGDVVNWSGGFSGAADLYPVLCLYDENKTLYNYYATQSDPRKVTIGSTSSARYCRFAFLNTNIGAYISVNGVNKFVWDGVFFRMASYTKEEVDELLSEESDDGGANSNNEKHETLPLVDLVNSDTLNGVLYDNPAYNSLRVTSRSALVVPKVGRTWHVKLPDNISLYLWVGHSENPGSTHPAGRVINGGSFVFTDAMLIYRPVFSKGADYQSPLSASEVIEMVENGEIEIYSNIEKEENTPSRLRCCDAQVGAARWIRTNVLADNQLNRLPTFAHISDVHGDYERYRHCIEYILGLFGGIDGVLDTGDSAIYYANSGTTFRVSLANEFTSLPFLGVCIGNHEVFAATSPVPDVFENNIQELASIYNYLSADNTVTVKTYWYKDFADKKIRLISLDMHEGGYYKGNYSQAQITWFINTLKSTPSGYGVILMHHETEDKLDAIVGKTDFNQIGFNPQDYRIDGKTIIANIIDAFISRSTYSDTYTENGFSYYGTGNGSGENVTVNADFTTISDDTIEFIAHLVGHSHRDFIGKYHNSAQYQLCLMVSTGNCLCPWQQNPEWANSSDLPRGDSGLTQDLFNIYCIDRDNGTIRIARVGSDITEQMAYRKMMIVPYK